MSPRDLVIQFIEQINQQNVSALCMLMTEDHRFIDALGMKVEGREQMLHAWTGYFHLVPDYWISCDEIFEHQNVVAAFGTAGGTYSPNGELLKENMWQVPAAWRAEIADGLISEWRVYTDNEPIRQLMARSKR